MMSMHAAFDLDRSMRVAIGRAATLRNDAQTPVDVIVEDISRSGCLVRADVLLAAGTAISIGIPGLGVRLAEISRADHPHYGCAFLNPISGDDVTIAQDVDTLVHADFATRVRPMGHSDDDAASASARSSLSLRTRVAVIIGSSIALWLSILLAVKLFFF